MEGCDGCKQSNYTDVIQLVPEKEEILKLFARKTGSHVLESSPSYITGVP